MSDDSVQQTVNRFLEGLPVPGVKRAADDLVEARVTPRYWPGIQGTANRLEVDYRLNVSGAAKRFYACGATVGFRARDILRQAQSSAIAVEQEFQGQVSILPVSLAPGKQTGVWVVMAIVELAPNQYSVWFRSDEFEFEM